MGRLYRKGVATQVTLILVSFDQKPAKNRLKAGPCKVFGEVVLLQTGGGGGLWLKKKVSTLGLIADKLVTGMRWIELPNKSSDQIGKKCPKNVQKLCSKVVWDIFRREVEG